ncbi:MAG: glutaredoxin 3 [Pseudomonadota bacterium]
MSKIEIYTNGWCSFCVRAKRLLDSKGVEYQEYGIDQEPGKRAEMIQRSGRLTVPQIFIGETHVGGSDDLARAEQTGELDRLLAELDRSAA